MCQLVLFDSPLEGVRVDRLNLTTLRGWVLRLVLVNNRGRLFFDLPLFEQELFVLLLHATLLLFVLLLDELFVLLNDLLFLADAILVFSGVGKVLLVLRLHELLTAEWLLGELLLLLSDGLWLLLYLEVLVGLDLLGSEDGLEWTLWLRGRWVEHELRGVCLFDGHRCR